MKKPTQRNVGSPKKQTRLSDRCLRELTDQLPRLLACKTRKELSEVTTQILSRYIDMANSTLAALDPARGQAYMLHSSEEMGLRIKRNLPAHFDFHDESVYFQDKVDQSLRQLCQTSDSTNDKALGKTALFKEFHPSTGCQRHLILLIESHSDGTRASFGIQHEGKDFTARERAVFEFLRPYILTAYDRIVTLERSTAALEGLTNSIFKSAAGVIELDSAMQILRVNQAAEVLLHRMGGKSQRGENLPQLLSTGAMSAQTESLEQGFSKTWNITVGQDFVSAEMAWNSQTETFVLLLESKLNLDPARSFGFLRLSPRQSEVLFWIAQGKSNDEIAIILGVSSSTVAKHVEHIFIKLGVETRTAAAAQAWAMSLPGLDSKV